MEPATPPIPAWRRALPFALALALVAFVFSRVDLAAFQRSLARVDLARFIAVSLCFSVGLLLADAIATVPLYRRLVGPVGYGDFVVFRGASYLPSLVNHHLGQAALTWFLSKGCGLPLWRVAGATLVGYASWAACLLGAGCLALLLSDQPVGWLALPLGAGFAYLGLLAVKPASLARRALLAPLFEAGVVGHLLAVAARLPHMTVMFVGTWASFGLFGVDIPFAMALRYIPLLMVALTLPITPQGFGTRDAVASLLLAGYAPGETAGERLAVVVAATSSWGVVTTVWEALIGVACTRVASARGRGRREEVSGGAGGGGHAWETGRGAPTMSGTRGRGRRLREGDEAGGDGCEWGTGRRATGMEESLENKRKEVLKNSAQGASSGNC